MRVTVLDYLGGLVAILNRLRSSGILLLLIVLLLGSWDNIISALSRTPEIGYVLEFTDLRLLVGMVR